MNVASDNQQRMLTFKGGGWVLLIMAGVCFALIAWAITPAIFMGERPPGDGRNVESYGFDLTTLRVPQETLAPIMQRRDMVPVMFEPEFMSASDLARVNEEERGKYLVSRDRVVGVVVNGEARAYPVTVLTVHEVIHDVLGGVPIAVTYTWPGDAVRVFDRRLDGEVLTFGVSGLASNAHGLLYDKQSGDADQALHGESLWSQLTGVAVAGPAAEAGQRLRTLPAQVVRWSHWMDLYPQSSVVKRDQQYLRRYRKSTPDSYFRSPLLPPYPIDPIPDRNTKPAWKDRVIVVHTGRPEERRVYPLLMIGENARNAMGEAAKPDVRWLWTDDLDGVELRFEYDAETNTAAVLADAPIHTAHCFWFAWYAAERSIVGH